MYKQSEIITCAKPHSIKKFNLIANYVDEWARKILGYNGKNGFNGSAGIIYIDCMSNSGVYRDENNNIVEGTALLVAKKINRLMTNYPTKEAILYFNDKEASRINYLKNKIEKEHLINIKVKYSSDDCNSFLQKLAKENISGSYNTLLIYDPYDASINWNSVTPFLNRWGEVIFNHMVSDTTRAVTQAKSEKIISKYENTYQQNINSLIEKVQNKEDLNDVIINIIKSHHTKENNLYTASFPFFSRRNGLIYNLIFCSTNIIGFKLFKRIAWKTFGNKSSLKNTHGSNNQQCLDFDDTGINEIDSDDQCFYITDIAKYIYEKYSNQKEVRWEKVVEDLDIHPIFPSDGYKNPIKSELKKIYNVSISRKKGYGEMLIFQ